MIACLRLPYFAALLAQRDEARLRNMPLVLVDEDRVVGLSPEAAQLGVRAGMPLRQAQMLDGSLRVEPAAPARTRRVFEDLLAALTLFTPQVEPEEELELRADARARRDVPVLPAAQVDDQPAATCYLDFGRLSEADTLELAYELHRTVRAQLALPARVGLASGKFPARVAAAALDNHEVLTVTAGQEADFLAPFTTGLLPVDGETARQLHLLGLVTLGHVAAQPVGALLDRFGKIGRVMHRLASGRDTRPVQTYTPRVVYRQARALESPAADWPTLHAALDGLLAALLVQADGRAVRQVELALVQDDGRRLEGTLALRGSSGNGTHLRQTVHELAGSLDVTSGVVEVELVLSDLAPVVPRQLSLFEREPVSQEQLRAILRSLVARHGEASFYWMRLTDPDARLPERRFRLDQADDA